MYPGVQPRKVQSYIIDTLHAHIMIIDYIHAYIHHNTRTIDNSARTKLAYLLTLLYTAVSLA